MIWVDLTQPVEGLTRTKDWPPPIKREFCQQTAFGSELQHRLFLGFQPEGPPWRFGLICLHNRLSSFLKSNLFLHTSILVVLVWQRELWRHCLLSWGIGVHPLPSAALWGAWCPFAGGWDKAMSAQSYRCTQHSGEKTTDILKQARVSCKLESKVCLRWKNKAGDFRDTL